MKATAGLRLLPGDRAESILDAIRQELVSNWPFFFPDSDAVSILDGKDEGLYAWLTVNYLLGNFKPTPDGRKRPTAAVMDLGGGSTQLVFEPHFDDAEKMQSLCSKQDGGLESDMCEAHFETKTLGAHDYRLYQNSFLGFGLMEARRQIKAQVLDFIQHHRQPNGAHQTDHGVWAGLMLVDRKHQAWRFVSSWAEQSGSQITINDNDLIVSHPCLAHSHIEMLSEHPHRIFLTGPVRLDNHGKHHDQDLTHQRCAAITARIFNKDAECTYDPPHCSFNGVYQPPIHDSFANLAGAEIYAFSYFFDRTDALVLDHDENYHGNDWQIMDLKRLAETACVLRPHHLDDDDDDPNRASVEHPWLDWRSVGKRLHRVLFGERDGNLRPIPELCLDLTFMHHLLETGYGLRGNQPVRIRKRIAGIETGWCLGATIDVISNSLRQNRLCAP